MTCDPYSLVIKFHGGREQVQASGHNPTDVHAAHTRISRNPQLIDRIELRDFDGVLDTVWSSSWRH